MGQPQRLGATRASQVPEEEESPSHLEQRLLQLRVALCHERVRQKGPSRGGITALKDLLWEKQSNGTPKQPSVVPAELGTT